MERLSGASYRHTFQHTISANLRDAGRAATAYTSVMFALASSGSDSRDLGYRISPSLLRDSVLGTIVCLCGDSKKEKEIIISSQKNSFSMKYYLRSK